MTICNLRARKVFIFAFGCAEPSLQYTGLPVVASLVAEHRLSSCGARVQSLRSTWAPPRPEIKPVSVSLAGGLPTTGLPGKSIERCFKSR